ncbi:LEAF RUST 10 DISEASE-RESISTANCE LOCUS RECEPTOR-LIKE PROTEIN KINASE-like 1.2 isoform X1 [Musa acuminata AAA Group]|uniref:LEAF RUST 10 DISEASE-RESISTANCE LOCUS RECEPTOR-LIKE PROTEIN KINASE-like 1.2 isoform X1 n=1 Tax=Musa acuminata AAA Group TaxID=214697 RepID=UPI0031DD506E
MQNPTVVRSSYHYRPLPSFPNPNMNSKFPTPPLPISAFFFLLLLFSVPAISHPSNVACGEAISSCGNITNITYPFWLVHDDSTSLHSHCGYRGFELICRNNTLIIHLPAGNYTVTNIDYKTRTISLVDTDIVSVHEECPRVNHNLTFDPDSILRYAPSDVNLTFFFDCIDPPRNIHIPCLGSAGGNRSYVFTTETMRESYHRLPRTCRAVVVVPVLREVLTAYIADDLPTRYGGVLQSGFNLSWPNVTSGDCGSCERSGGRCGLNRTSNSTWNFTCFCSDGLKTFHPHCAAHVGHLKAKIKGIIIGVSAATGVFLLLCTCYRFYKHKKKRQFPPSSKSLSQSASLKPSLMDPEMDSALLQTHVFSYAELEEATNKFDASNTLGDGGFCTVYKGKIQDGRTVAVKRLYENNYRRVEQFMNEIQILSRLRHQRLVILYGCTSHQSRELLLVYEFVSNGTLAHHLHGSPASQCILTWPMRLRIAIETADALAYLHAVNPPVIHRDVKTNNILLDSNFHVKVADFGLSRLIPKDVTHISTAPQGTPGYLDPEYHQCFQLTDKSDVYSFGVVLFELITSKPAVDMTRNRSEINLANMAITRIQKGELEQLVDAALGYQSDEVTRKMITMVAEVAFRCLQSDGDMRPPIKEVLEVLQAIESDGNRPEKKEHGVAESRDDAELLKNTEPFSPDSVMNRWTSRSTTPQASE